MSAPHDSSLMENKLKHLEFIQAVITRFNGNSFLIKGWAVTLASALFALAAKDADQTFIRVIYVSVPVFWILDAYYLSQERQYRGLYNAVRKIEPAAINFLMDASSHATGSNTWFRSLWASTLLIFYGLLAALPAIVTVVFKRLTGII